ncbi:MAG TPA: GNAT family N-acetyltransferase [Pseudonocardia sp.]|uniref:GNAT family N-acetyltransferase n=1 Tax=Pseudonocardia sp. TaxID=60912 RepID=UPI002BB5CD1E|nr:GNAT family N-acetyltransferase [Pseudonocardia sp.]HTF53970.1 GNAT family N-acetyltransferase [Pseudonocardia sp.]
MKPDPRGEHLMAERHEIAVRNNPDANRYEASVDGELAGFAFYRLAPGQVVFVHTEVQDGYEGQGVGGALAKAALDDVRRQGKKAAPVCEFIAGYIRRHPDYVDLVDEAYRNEVLPSS